MLEVDLAEKLIEKLGECTNYNINIMNEKGIIIASKDRSRIGTFHEIAYRIIEEQLEFLEVDNENTFLGVKTGINMALKYKKDIIGVIGLTGEIKEIKPIALIIKKTMETILEYELHKEKIFKRQSAKEKFLYSLLYEEADENHLRQLAHSLGYSDQVMRIPMEIIVENSKLTSLLLDKIQKNDMHSKEDITLSNAAGKITIFKSYPEKIQGFFENYQYFIGEYLHGFLRYTKENQIGFKLYVGSLQINLRNYRDGYQHCLWLEKHISAKRNSVFFYDYLDEYLKYQIPLIELHKIFETFSVQYSEDFKETFVKHIESLYYHNYNLLESSKDLYIHKNTLSFRLEKIKGTLGLNPMQNNHDRELMNYLYYYFKKTSS